jgi:hypothetical protein
LVFWLRGYSYAAYAAIIDWRFDLCFEYRVWSMRRPRLTPPQHRVSGTHYVEGPSGPPATSGKKASRGTKAGVGGGGGGGGGFIGFLGKLTALTCAGVIGHLHGAAVTGFVEEKLGELSGGGGKDTSGGALHVESS